MRGVLLNQKDSDARKLYSGQAPRELKTFPDELEDGKAQEISVGADEDAHMDDEEDYHSRPRDSRKSPAALFGSQSIGQVVLPVELQKSISMLISGESHIARQLYYFPSDFNYSRTKNRTKRRSTATPDVSSCKTTPIPTLALTKANTKDKRHGKQNTSSKNTKLPNKPVNTQFETAQRLRP
jgi:hypothetical protein